MRAELTSKILRVFVCTLAMIISSACVAGDTPVDDLKARYRRPTQIPFPSNNPYSPEKAALGKALFFDPRLSGNQNMNCATCHNPSFGWKVPLPRAVGSLNTPLSRSAPTLLNLAWASRFFWDGRAPTLEEQVKDPIEDGDEMNLPFRQAVSRLKAIEGYRSWFDQVFPGAGVTADTITMAIATYERTIVSGYAPFDAWIDGDENAISVTAKQGFVLFNGKGNCAACHFGWNFTDEKFHDIGTPSDDIGRSEFEPGNPKAVHAFKTPGLRDINLRAPYLHDGSLKDLDAVLTQFVSGGVVRPSLSPDFHPVDLTKEEKAKVIEFLDSLTAGKQMVALPILPH